MYNKNIKVLIEMAAELQSKATELGFSCLVACKDRDESNREGYFSYDSQPEGGKEICHRFSEVSRCSTEVIDTMLSED